MGRLMTRPRWGLPARSRAAHARDAALAEVRARTGWARATWADVPDALRHAYAALDERGERIVELAEETARLAHELVPFAGNGSARSVSVSRSHHARCSVPNMRRNFQLTVLGARDDAIARLTDALAAARRVDVSAVPCDDCGRLIALNATWGDHTTIADLLDARQPDAPRDDREVDAWNRQHADTCRRIVWEYRNRWLYPEDGTESYIITRCGELGLSDDNTLYG